MRNLVQGFINFTHWPVSRKVLLIGVTGVPATLLAAIMNAWINDTHHAGLLNPGLLNIYMWVWITVQTVSTLLIVPAARAGDESRWTAFFFTATQAPFIACLIYLFGTMGTPLFAIFPAIVLLWTISLDERIGMYGLCNIAAWILLSGFLEWQGLIPHAPLVQNRSIDAQADPVWFLTAFFHILVLLCFCMFVCSLLLRAQRHQERRLHAARVDLERANRLISRYVPAQLADQINRGQHHEAVRPQRRKLTIVFTDVEGFTALSDQLDPEALAAVLDEYLSEMVAVADHYGGTVNQIIGDGMMIFFGAPLATNDLDHALRAVQMAADMQARMQQIGLSWSRHGVLEPLRIRIGINTGYASVGDFGSAGRKLYSGIGLQTNLASRIQACCAPGRILLSHNTWALVREAFACQPCGEMHVRGINHAVKTYELLGRITPGAEPSDDAEPSGELSDVQDASGAGPGQLLSAQLH